MRVIFFLLLVLGITPLLWSAHNYPPGFHEEQLPPTLGGVLHENLMEEDADEDEEDALQWLHEQNVQGMSIVGQQVPHIFSSWFQGLPPLTEATIHTYLQAIQTQGTKWLIHQFQFEALLTQFMLPSDVQTAPNRTAEIAAVTEMNTWFNHKIFPKQGAPICISETMEQLLPPDLDLADLQTIQKVLEGILGHLLAQYVGQNMLLAIQHAAFEERFSHENSPMRTMV